MLRCRTRSMVERLTLLIPPKFASSSITRFCISFSLMALSWRTMSMMSASCCWENIGRLPLSRGRFASLQKGNKQLQKYNKTLMGISFQSKFVMKPPQNKTITCSLLSIAWLCGATENLLRLGCTLCPAFYHRSLNLISIYWSWSCSSFSSQIVSSIFDINSFM